MVRLHLHDMISTDLGLQQDLAEQMLAFNFSSAEVLMVIVVYFGFNVVMVRLRYHVHARHRS